MRNITLSAEEDTIEAARARARQEHTTLNEQFRRWLADYARPGNRVELAMRTIADLQGRLRSGGRRFTRDQMNER
jgi:hypothetical protein